MILKQHTHALFNGVDNCNILIINHADDRNVFQHKRKHARGEGNEPGFVFFTFLIFLVF